MAATEEARESLIPSEAFGELNRAIEEGNNERIQHLLTNVPQVLYLMDNNNWSALHRAAWEGQTLAFRVLLQAGAQLTPNIEGYGPLHFAVHRDHSNILIEFIANGRSIEELNMRATSGGRTFFHQAIESGRFTLIEQVLTALPAEYRASGVNAQIGIDTNYGQRPLHLAIRGITNARYENNTCLLYTSPSPRDS